jgi:WD40 repeat protein
MATVPSRAGRECLSVNEPVRAIASAPGSTLFQVGAGRSLVTLRGPSCELAGERRSPCEIDAIAVSPSGDQTAVGCRGGRLLFIDAATNEVRRTLRSTAGGYHELAWSRDARLLAAGHLEPQVTLFDVAGGEALGVLDAGLFDDEGRTAVVFSPDGRWLATTAYNTLRLWPADLLLESEGRHHVERGTLPPRTLSVRGHAHLVDLEFSLDGASIAALSESEGRSAIHLWQIQSGRKLGRIPLPRPAVRLVWLRRQALLAAAEVHGEGVSVWSARTQRAADLKLDGASGENVTALAASADQTVLLAGTERGKVLLWTIEDAVGGR